MPSTLLFPYFLGLMSSQQVFCCSISWRIQNPVRSLRMSVLRKLVMAKYSITLEILWFFDDIREEGVGSEGGVSRV